MVRTYCFPDCYSEFKGYWEEKYPDNSAIFVNYVFIYLFIYFAVGLHEY